MVYVKRMPHTVHVAVVITFWAWFGRKRWQCSCNACRIRFTMWWQPPFEFFLCLLLPVALHIAWCAYSNLWFKVWIVGCQRFWLVSWIDSCMLQSVVLVRTELFCRFPENQCISSAFLFMSRVRDVWELVLGMLRRLYSKEVGGRGPGPRWRAGAMAEALGAARRQEPRPMFRYNLRCKLITGQGLYMPSLETHKGNKL